MEKNKNRTDMLAAGRKKLQQFRQKKDNKGNSSKPSGKGSKSGRDKTEGTVAEAAGELSNHDTVDISESSSGVVAEASDTATGISKHDVTGDASNDTAVQQLHNADGQISKHDAEDTTALPESIPRVDTVASDAASRVDPVTSESPVANKDTSAKGKVGIACLLDVAGFPPKGSRTDDTSDGHDVDIRASLEDGSSSLVLEETTINVPAMVLEERSGDSNLLLPTVFSSGLEREHGEEQVTDVGAMQEVGGSGGNETDDRMVNFLDGDSNPPTDDANDSIADRRAADSGNRFVEENISVATQLSKIDNASLADSVANYAGEAEEPRDHSFGTSPLIESSMMSTVRSVAMGHERDVTSFGPNDEKPEAVNFSDTEGTQANSGFFEVERSYEVESNNKNNFLACKHIDLSSILDGSVVKLSQLAEILQVLDQDEFRYIFMSRESSAEKPRNADKRQAPDDVIHDSFERLKEHLYMTSLSKDVCYLQLSEHQKGIDGIAVNSSLVEVEGKNDTIAKEIVQYRNELQESLSEKVELEKQLRLSRSEADVFAAKVNELQNKLEMTQGEMSGIFSELVECRNLVQALQSENENLNVSFKVMIEEKNKLSQESTNVLLENEKITEELYQHRVSLESFQTLIQDDRKRLEQENYGMISENSKLLAGLAECENTVEVLRVENKNLKEILTSLSEERKKFDEEKVSMDHQIGKMSEESVNCKEMILTLQTEIINLNEHMRSISEEKSKLVEEKNTIFSEYEKQYHKLVEFNVLEAVLQAECCKAVKDLKEARTSIKHYTDENKSLCADLEFHKIKLKDIDCQKNSSQFDEVESQGVKNDTGVLHESKSHQSSSRQMKLDIYSDAFGFLALKRNLEEAGVLMQKLEREIESMHLESSSLNRSTDAVSPEVSRLIQTFEPKGYTEKDGQDPEKSPSSEGHTTEDSHMSTKMVAQNLKILLKELVSDAEDASEFCRVKHSKVLANAAGTDLSKYDALEEHNDQVHKANIELMVFYEAMRELIHHGVAKESELLGQCDAMQKQEAVLKLENHHLQEKMNDFQGHINELQVQLEGHCRDSDEMTSSISNQLQALQSEVSDRELILQEEQSSVAAQILKTVAMLDSTVNNISANPLPIGNSNPDVVGSVAASVDGACKVIQGLHGLLEASQSEFQEMSHKTDVALSILHRLYSELVRTLFGYDPDAANKVVADGKRLDLLHPNFFDALLDQLKNLYIERLELQSTNTQLSSQMTNTARETDELQKLCLKSDTVLKLIDEIEQSVKLERPAVSADEPASLLESLIHLLIQKCRETGQGSSLCASLEMHVHDLQGEVERLNFVLMEYGNENLVFKHSLKSAQEVVIALNSKVQEKVVELELSEQRISSLREKLGIAVTKGKGLISQRESLKQSLSETSKELEKCSQELLSKDARLHEVETKVKVYAEAGERMEALESELSYIRNSATALRESFLLKDSVLLRIEEILEDLELPENFHSNDIIDKIDWLAKMVGNHSLPLGEWDHRSSAEGVSYSDAGFGSSDGLKEDMQPTPTSSEDLRRRYEELQNRFYGLAEQNEMLEQSLMERNNLVQRWEIFLDTVDMPSHLRSGEPDDKIQWLGSALSEAQNHSYSLQQKIDNLETFCGSLRADVEDSQRRTSELEAAFHQACSETEMLTKDLEILRQENDESIKRIAVFSLRNENLQNESSLLQAQKLRLEEDKDHIEDVIRKLKEMVKNALRDSCPEDVVLDQEGVEYFEEILRKLVEEHKTLSSGNLVNVDSTDSTDVHITGKEELSNTSRDFEEQDVTTLSKKLDESMGELMSLKEEKDGYMQTNQSLVRELQELEVKKKELEELLNREERKSASLREKLNIAVRKGKSLVQQRDGMKQSIEELNAEVERLKSESKHTDKTISEYEEQIKNLLVARDRVQVVESENSFLRDRLAETEHHMLEKEGSWSSILNALDEIDVGFEINSVNPVERITEIGKYLHGLHGRMDSLEQDSRKSKRAAELLLAELNEVQERNDVLQDELAKVVDELSEASREKDLAENAKHEAVAHIEKLSYLHSEEKKRQISEITVLKFGVDNVKNDLSAIDKELGDALSKDLEVLYNVKATMESFFDLDVVPDLGALFPGSLPGGTLSTKSENKVFMTQIDSIRERIHEHSRLLQEESSRLSEVVMNVHRGYTSEKEFYESVKRDAERLQSIDKEEESKLHILHGNMTLLFENCASAISRLENWQEHMVENALASRSPQRNLNSQNQIGENISIGDASIFNEESIRSMCDKLSLVVGDSISMHTNELGRVMEVGQSEKKSTIMNLQNELQEKDIQKEKICKELVGQIKEAETNAKNYLLDLQQARVKLDASQRQLDAMGEERKLLDQRVKELQVNETNAIDLQQKVNSLTDALAAKVQECEGLMQALDEEETEMEILANKIVGFENELHQKNKDLENLEASRAKALKKLSVTVIKFDELHYLSENLLSEVEKLQSQLQEKDGEISFLRQEVTRCTNDALAVTQMSKKSSDEIRELLAWLDSSISHVQVNDVTIDYSNHLVDEYKEVLQKKILDLISELENLRVTTQNRDIMLQEERFKVDELTQKEQHLKNSLREMESQLFVLQGVGGSDKATKSTSEIVEVEPTKNKWKSSGTIAPQVRSLRKPNNDQVAIAIDMDGNSPGLEDDDDDKAHGFKSLTTSKIVPRFTRPVSNMVDGLWMSIDRALMRQPALRLGVILYWALMHAMLATFVV
ncbi:golgin subfamily B member 1-like [Salvia splendens]|uniref:golgin subfamily B member 1-like n=1 Tax=Salvia splendens TaxID=180675 RepID=UPI001C25E1CF|nr:golgin subfamily B member 1-like [Salvia splendens]